MTIEKTSALYDLSGKVAVVTGAGRGIGRAVALRLAGAGAAVVACDLSEDGCAGTCAQIAAAGGKALAVGADVSVGVDQQRIVDAAVEAFGGIDILVNNAAVVSVWATWDVLQEADWDRAMAVNQRAVFFLAQKVARQMVVQGRGGAIVNLASTAAAHPVRYKIDYNAAKAAVIGLTRSLAVELGPESIRVNAVGPGGTRTEGAVSVVNDQVRQVGEAWAARMPWPEKIAEPDDIANAVLFFASPAAGFVTGQALYVDGGYLVG